MAGIKLVAFIVTAKENFHYLIVKADDNTAAVKEEVNQSWNKIAPDDPFEGFLQDDVFTLFMANLQVNNTINLIVSGIAVLLSAMGLYGLVSYNLTRRMREFSVRKVFGANTFQIFKLMNKDYLWMVLLALGVGAPIGTYFMNSALLSLYPERIPFTILPNVICIFLMVITIGLTLISQLKRIVYENPVNTLKND